MLTALELARICEGKLYGKDSTFSGFCSDSREVKEGNIFVALRGSRHDGHDFVHEVFLKGAVGAIVEKKLPVPDGKFLLVVEDTLSALRRIATYRRERFKGKVIGVAGSAGKTTTKEMISFLLSKKGKVCKTPKNYNSQIGVPLSIANFDDDCDFWVVEMGASQKGDVKKLVDIVKPHVRVITAIGEEHLETFGCLDDVILGNGEIFEDMRDEDWAILPYYVSHCYDLKKAITFGDEGQVKAQDVKLTSKGINFKVNGMNLSLPIPSLALMENVLCTLCVLKALGYDWDEFASYLTIFEPSPQRFNLIKKENLLIIDDTYNANPPSVRKALESLSLFEGYKIALLGDMLELGTLSEMYHREVGRLCAHLNIDKCIFYGRNMRFAYEECLRYNVSCYHTLSREKLMSYIRDIIKEGSVILIKGSRGMEMEYFVRELEYESECVFGKGGKKGKGNL